MTCGAEADDIAHGRYRLTPPKARAELEVGGNRLTLVERVRCPGAAGGHGFYQATAIDDDVTDVAIVKPVPPPPPAKAR